MSRSGWGAWCHGDGQPRQLVVVGSVRDVTNVSVVGVTRVCSAGSMDEMLVGASHIYSDTGILNH